MGGKVLVRCDSGFEKQADGNLTCQASGEWDKRMPKCRGKGTKRHVENVRACGSTQLKQRVKAQLSHGKLKQKKTKKQKQKIITLFENLLFVVS